MRDAAPKTILSSGGGGSHTPHRTTHSGSPQHRIGEWKEQKKSSLARGKYRRDFPGGQQEMKPLANPLPLPKWLAAKKTTNVPSGSKWL